MNVLVRELMTRDKHVGSPRDRRCPVLVVEGFRGTGKTALLSELDDLLDQKVPYARLDLETNRHVSVPEVLSALAFDLSRKCPGYGALQFPRLIAGQLVMQLTLELNDRSQAYQQVKKALKRKRGIETVRTEVLLKAASDVITILGQHFGWLIKPPNSWVRLILKPLIERIPGRRIALGSFKDWYRHQDLGLSNDPIDVLVNLNLWATNSEDEHNRKRIDELLCNAFLADLRAEFGQGRWTDRRLNCVILLDNADSDLAGRFLNQLVRTRRERAVGDQDDADPLTVVATSRSALLSHVPGTDLTDVPSMDTEPASPGNTRPGQLSHTAGWSRFWWLRYRLPDLTRDEVGRAVTRIGLSWGNNQRIARVVYQLTGGHPASTWLVLDAISRSAPQRWIEPEAILSQAQPDATSQPPPTVEDHMLDHMLEDLPPATRRDLTTCAAARDKGHALVLAGQDNLLIGGQVGYREDLDPILWPTEESAGHTLLRRLLRRSLARRGSTVAPNWSSVYDRLRHICRADGDEADELYYALADGELGLVTRRLHQRLDELDATAWDDLLTSITEAPHRHRGQETPIDEVGTLVSSADLEQPLTSVGRLVAALRIAADPFTDSRRRTLHLQIAQDYSDVSRLCRGPRPQVVFLEAARRHSREADWWD